MNADTRLVLPPLSHRTVQVFGGTADADGTARHDVLAAEVPVALVFNGISHAVMMATPQDIEAFALGFALSEGILDAAADCRGIEVNIVDAAAAGLPAGVDAIEVQLEISTRSFERLKGRRRSLATQREAVEKADSGALQEEIAALMVAEAQAGHRVVRLKGGDPFVFGRGGEELEAVRAAGIDVVVVPGITAALGCAASAGIPLTHRGQSQAVSFVTAETRPGGPAPDWSSLAAPNHTLAVYMGVAGAAAVQAGLLEAGRAPDTPVAVIENGSRPEQRVVTGRLDGLARLVAREKVVSPALLIVGEVAAWAQPQAVARKAAA